MSACSSFLARFAEPDRFADLPPKRFPEPLADDPSSLTGANATLVSWN
jgi:hypothetical protein